jgi:hypothetical protein
MTPKPLEAVCTAKDGLIGSLEKLLVFNGGKPRSICGVVVPCYEEFDGASFVEDDADIDKSLINEAKAE